MLAVALIVVAMLLMFSASSVIAGPLEGVPCNGDFNNDGNVDATDVTEFLVHFGRNQFNDPCPPTPEAPVEKSGQTTSYATGDNGDLETGVAWPNPRFTDNGDGTVTDNLTGLIWLKNANCFGQRTWNNALSDCNGLSAGYCGLTDGSNSGMWRLPQIKELQSLIDFKNIGPPLPSGHPFQNVQAGFYSSSTTFADGIFDIAWCVDMIFGDVVSTYFKYSSSFYVWPVRGGQ
jgi:hypothetical protein